jgi:tetratricopeptide (TPR) repeat protein
LKKFLIFLILLINIKINIVQAKEKIFSEFIIPAGKDLRAVVTGDFDHNNISDIALCDYELNCIHILLWQKNGEFIQTSYQVGQNPLVITSGDFNSDGNIDLITANSALNELVFLYGTGDGKFIVKKGEGFYKSRGKISLLYSCDLDKDGKTDVITGGENTGLVVLSGQGDGTFREEREYEDIQHPVDLTVDDFNMDNIPDIAIIDNISKNSSAIMPDMPSDKKRQVEEIVIITGGEDGKTDRFKGGAGELGNIRSCYFNDDIYPDLVISNPDENQVIVILNLGQGSFGEKRFIKTGITPEGLNIKDINEDGFTEIITADSGSNTISIIKSSEKQNIINSYKTGNNPDIVATGDFNCDGNTDIVSLSCGKPFIYMLWGLGGGDFYDGLCGITGESPLSLCKGDFNNDGITDIVTANSLSQDLSILLGTGNGTFYGFPVRTREYPSCVISEDFNKDGNLDLAVTNKLYNGISVLLGNGKGEFTDKWSGKTGKRPVDVISGDFNNDGHIDLSVANSKSNSISILTGQGDGTFEKGEIYNTGEEPVKIVKGDFNCDKKDDIACAESASKKLSLFPGKGDGTFLPPLSFPMEGKPVYLLSDDLDKNGFSDLIVADYDSKKLFLFKGDKSKFLINTDQVILQGKPLFLTSGRDGIIAACEENIITFIEKIFLKEKIDFFTENSPVAVITGNFVSNTGEDMVYLTKDDRHMKLLINKSHLSDLQKEKEERKNLIKEADDFLDKGIYYEKQKNYSSARENYEKALKLNPASKEIYYRMGLMEEESEHTDRAIELYLKVLNLTSINGSGELSEETRSELNSHLGYCYYKEGKIEEGKALCRREQDKNPLAIFTLGLIYLKNDENALALHTFKKYLDSNFLYDKKKEKQNYIEAREFIVTLELKYMGSWLPLIENLESPGNKEAIEKLKLYKNYKARDDLIKSYRKIISTDKTITQRSLPAIEEILSDYIKEPWKKDGYVTTNDLYYSPFDKNTVYITPSILNNKDKGITGSCLYKSEDRGLTWIKLLKTDNIIISVTLIKSDTIIVCTGGREISEGYGSIIRTSDGGFTWEKVKETPSSVKRVLLSGNMLYVLTEESGLFASKDAGAIWYLCGFEPEPAGKQIPPVPKNSILTNKIKNWTDNLEEEGKINIEKIFENRAGKIFVLLSKSDYNLNKELTAYNYIIKSDNSGNTWESVGFPQKENYLDLYGSYKIDNKDIFWYRSKGKGLTIFSINEKGELYIKYNGYIDLHKSTDEGKNWQFIPSVPGNKIYNIDIDAKNPEIITVTTDGGLFKSTDGGVTWD